MKLNKKLESIVSEEYLVKNVISLMEAFHLEVILIIIYMVMALESLWHPYFMEVGEEQEAQEVEEDSEDLVGDPEHFTLNLIF